METTWESVAWRIGQERIGQRLSLGIVPADGDARLKIVNLAGLARARTREFKYSEEMKERFRNAQDEARKNRRGIWSK